MTGRYLMRCANAGCEMRQRTTVNPGRDGWPVHCGKSMVFATTFEEERFASETLAAERPETTATAKAKIIGEMERDIAAAERVKRWR